MGIIRAIIAFAMAMLAVGNSASEVERTVADKPVDSVEIVVVQEEIETTDEEEVPEASVIGASGVEEVNDNPSEYCKNSESMVEGVEYSKEASVGRVVIPGLVDLELCYAATDPRTNQEIVDSGAAALMQFGDETIIGAHKHMGFSAMKTSVPNSTVAYIDGNAYICVDNFKGHNATKHLTDENSNKVEWPEGIVMYTCNDKWQNVTITLWSELE